MKTTSGSVLLQGSGSACDTCQCGSQFVNGPVYQLNATICPDESIVVNGVVANKDKTRNRSVPAMPPVLDVILSCIKLLVSPQPKLWFNKFFVREKALWSMVLPMMKQIHGYRKFCQLVLLTVAITGSK